MPTKWLYAMYMILVSRKGISSLQLSKELGITQKSAWFLTHRIRAACGSTARQLLSGLVEVDEAYLGGNVVIDMIDRLHSLVRGVVGKRLTYRMLVHGI